MPTEEAVTTQPPESVSTPNVEPQAPAPSSQEPAQAQEGGSGQVETSQQQPSSQEPARPRPSDYYNSRKMERTIREQSNQIRQMAEMIQQIVNQQKPAVSDSGQPSKQIDPNEFWNDPIAFQQRREAQLREEIRKELLSEIPKTYEQIQSQERQTRNEQEALELIFPKSADSPNGESWRERALKDPQKMEMIEHILSENGLNEFSKTHPIEAARIAVRIYNDELKAIKQKTQNPNQIPKALVGGKPSGNPTIGGTKMTTLKEVKAEIVRMEEELDKNPNLRHDPAFKQRQTAVKMQLTQMVNQLTQSQEG